MTMIFDYILIPVAHADEFSAFLGRINEHIINPLIILLFAVAFVVFTLGLFKFFGARDNAADLDQAKQSMIWGVVGMAIMVSVFGIMSFITHSLGLRDGAVSGIRKGGDGDVGSLFDGGNTLGDSQ